MDGGGEWGLSVLAASNSLRWVVCDGEAGKGIYAG